MEDTLFSELPVAGEDPRPSAPVVVVGMPRSGSSFLSHILSQIPNYYVFDDLYLIDRAKADRAFRRIDDKKLDKLLFFLGWQIRARLRFGKYAIPRVDEDEVERMNDALRKVFTGKNASALDLQEEWMVRLAHRHGARNWGFKMPKAFFMLDTLRARHPDLKVIFLLRQPHDVLASFKHVKTSSGDGDPRRFHPLAYAVYWKLAARRLRRELATNGDNVLFIRFDELTKTPEDIAKRLAVFLNEPVPAKIEIPEKSNSSFGGGRRKTLTGLEIHIVNMICGPEISALGFDMVEGGIGVGDVADLIRTTFNFTSFHTSGLFRRLLRKG